MPPFPLRRAGSLRRLALGEGLLLLGLAGLALLFPVVASLWVTAAVALALLVAGLAGWVAMLLRAPRLGRPLVLGRLLVASLFVGAGLWMAGQLAADPLRARSQVEGLALALGLVFLVEGLVSLATALHHRGRRGWGWGLGNGLVTLALGLLILWLPAAALQAALGLLVGLSLLFSGLEMLLFGAGLHRGDGAASEVGGAASTGASAGTSTGAGAADGDLDEDRDEDLGEDREDAPR